MRKVRFTVTTADGGAQHFHRARDLIQRLNSGEWAALSMEAVSDDLCRVRITVPYGKDRVTMEPAVPEPGDRVRHLATGLRGVVTSCGPGGPAFVRVADVLHSWGLGEIRLE